METYNVSPRFIEGKNDNAENKKKFEFNEKNYLNLRLNPGETTRQVKIRILPVSATDQNFYLILNTHSTKVSSEVAKSGFKSFICLNEPLLEGKEERGCPLCNKYKAMLEESNSAQNSIERKALFKQATQYIPKKTFIVRVIERGCEEEGVKFWRFNAHTDGKGCYDQLKSLYEIRNNESIESTGEEYNIFDLIEGKDIIITLTKDPSTERVSTVITDAGFKSPLSKSEAKIHEWVNDEKKWSDMYATKNYEYLELIANNEIPFYNKETGSWVAKKQPQSVVQDNTSSDILRDETYVDDSENPDDLPF